MNRELRFRAWDDGKMVYEKDISHLSMEDNDILRLAKFWCNIRNDSKVMQFTGLTDKNGIEIYEGDVMSFDKYRYRVVFENGCFELYHEESIKEFDGTAARWGNLCRANELDLDIVVTGNIYENPELIKSPSS